MLGVVVWIDWGVSKTVDGWRRASETVGYAPRLLSPAFIQSTRTELKAPSCLKPARLKARR